MSAEPKESVDISGTWKNELGSTVTFTQNKQTISGVYVTKVSSHPLKDKKFPLNGNIGTGSPTSIGFAVTYQGDTEDEKSTCGWSGQYRNVNGQELIFTTWVLTSVVETMEEMWDSTNVGKDTFTRVYFLDKSK